MGEKQPIHQTLPMAEFAKLRSRKIQSPTHQQHLEKQKLSEKNHIAEKQRSEQQHLHQHLQHHNTQKQNLQQNNIPFLPRQQHMKHLSMSQKRRQEHILQQKKPHRQFCAPGSISAYLMMRQKQQSKEYGALHISPMHLRYEYEDEIDREKNPMDEQDGENHEHEKNGENAMDHEYALDEQDGENTIGEHDGIGPALQAEVSQESATRVAKKKYRGPTLMTKVHRRGPHERQIIVLNENGQPIGPSKAITNELSRFLGTLAKDPEFSPLNIISWKFMHTKDKIWNYVKEKYIIPEEGKKYVLESVNLHWRVYKSRLKELHYFAYATDDERWAKRPKTIPENQFRELLDYWDSELGQKIASTNKINRQKYQDVHTMGPSSIAMLRYELQQNDPNKQPPSQSMIDKKSRERDPTHVYKTNEEKTKENIEKINAIQVEIENGERSNNVDPYDEVITNEHSKHFLRLQGRGVTKSSLKSKDKNGGYILDQECF